MDRRTFLRRSAGASALAFAGPFKALSARAAAGAPLRRTAGYGSLVLKGDLWLPADFNYQVISRQGWPMSDGQLTPGIFDGMGAFRGTRGRAVLIRNHENRELAGEVKVAPGKYEYDPAMNGGNTKLEVTRTRTGRDPVTGQPLYEYRVVRDFAILGGTSTNCAGGVIGRSWYTCEEVVKGPTSLATATFAPKRHGYLFEIPSDADGPVHAVPVLGTGRFVHEAVAFTGGVLYLTEDRRRQADPVLGTIGGCFYRYIPDSFKPDYGDAEADELPPGQPPRRLSQTTGRLQALKLRGEEHANMEDDREVGRPYRVEWVDVPDPDHNDDTDDRRDRAPGYIPTRIQAQDRGAAWFEKMEGIWADTPQADDDDDERARKVFFACSDGGPKNKGAIWEYDPANETLTMLFASNDKAELENPDNAVIVPQTGDILVQEDGPDDEHLVRGITQDGEIYDFCRTTDANQSEFCGGCFDPDGHTLYVNQQGERDGLPDGKPGLYAVTYAIYGPFGKRR
jgi:secreted PhoX family phosphatase